LLIERKRGPAAETVLIVCLYCVRIDAGWFCIPCTVEKN